MVVIAKQMKTMLQAGHKKPRQKLESPKTLQK